MLSQQLKGLIYGLIPGFHPNMLPALGASKASVVPAIAAAYFASYFYMPNIFAPFKAENFFEEIAAAILTLALLWFFLPLIDAFIIFINFRKHLLLLFLLLVLALSTAKSRNPAAYILVFTTATVFGKLLFKLPEPDKAIMVYFSSFFLLNFLYQPPARQGPSRPESIGAVIPSAAAAVFIAALPALTPFQAIALARFLTGYAPYSPLAVMVASLVSCSRSFELLGRGRMLLVETYGSFTPPEVISALLLSVFLLFPFFEITKEFLGQLPTEVFAPLPVVYLLLFSGPYFPLFLPSTALILLAKLLEVEPTALLGFLLGPTILFYLSAVL